MNVVVKHDMLRLSQRCFLTSTGGYDTHWAAQYNTWLVIKLDPEWCIPFMMRQTGMTTVRCVALTYQQRKKLLQISAPLLGPHHTTAAPAWH